MRILYDAAALQERRTGIGNYVWELLQALEHLRLTQSNSGAVNRAFPQDFSLNVFDGARIQTSAAFINVYQSMPQPKAPPPKETLSFYEHQAWRAHFLKKRLRFHAYRKGREIFGMPKHDIVHATHFFPPFASPKAKILPLIYDLSPLTHPEWHPSARVKWFEKHLKSLEGHSHYTTISEFVAQEMQEVLGIARASITIIPPGVSDVFFARPDDMVGAGAAQILARFGLEKGQYFLGASTLEPRKNFKCLVEALRLLPPRLRQKFPLVIAGGAGWGALEFSSAAESLQQEGALKLIGYVEAPELACFYRHATGFLFPSFYEGYGMPVAEALACGARVAVSAHTASQEAGEGILRNSFATRHFPPQANVSHMGSADGAHAYMRALPADKPEAWAAIMQEWADQEWADKKCADASLSDPHPTKAGGAEKISGAALPIEAFPSWKNAALMNMEIYAAMLHS